MEQNNRKENFFIEDKFKMVIEDCNDAFGIQEISLFYATSRRIVESTLKIIVLKRYKGAIDVERFDLNPLITFVLAQIKELRQFKDCLRSTQEAGNKEIHLNRRYIKITREDLRLKLYHYLNWFFSDFMKEPVPTRLIQWHKEIEDSSDEPSIENKEVFIDPEKQIEKPVIQTVVIEPIIPEEKKTEDPPKEKKLPFIPEGKVKEVTKTNNPQIKLERWRFTVKLSLFFMVVAAIYYISVMAQRRNEASLLKREEIKYPLSTKHLFAGRHDIASREVLGPVNKKINSSQIDESKTIAPKVESKKPKAEGISNLEIELQGEGIQRPLKSVSSWIYASLFDTTSERRNKAHSYTQCEGHQKYICNRKKQAGFKHEGFHPEDQIYIFDQSDIVCAIIGADVRIKACAYMEFSEDNYIVDNLYIDSGAYVINNGYIAGNVYKSNSGWFINRGAIGGKTIATK